ncbi:hypothetical protein C3L33_11415, partial [Rhododendron williamsianum]
MYALIGYCSCMPQDDKSQDGASNNGLRRSKKKRDEKLGRVEAGLARARALIRDAMINQNRIFINLMETNTRFRTRDPDRAHVYYLPFSVVMILDTLFDPVIRDKAVLERIISGYVRLVSSKYPYWNRSLGADHFMLSCHDWGPRATWYVHQLYFTSIRVLCNANTSEHFNPKKDASFPEINLKTGEIEGLTGGLPASNRTVLAFFAGSAHGKIRPAFLKHWMEKDEDVRVYKNLPEGISYPDMMKKSRYCICPSGWEVASPRIVEAIYAECVPVLISQNYVLPFSDVLNWNSFSVQVSVSEIPNLKKILVGIPEDRYLRLQQGVRQVQRHFLVNDPPERFDVFHMIIHSIWLRRLNVADDTRQGGASIKSGFRRNKKKRDEKLGRVEARLARARALIRDAVINQNRSSPLDGDSDYIPQGDIYLNAYAFRRSYQLMERMFRIYIYEEGEPPLFHTGPCKDIYSMEGIFIKLMETNTRFRTRDPDRAHVYYLPFSVVMILETLFDPVTRSKSVLKRVIRGYIRLISTKYPYWNNSLGADHSMLSCHDWGPRATRYVPQLYSTSIRVLCNANTSERFNPKKDASLPEINLKTGEIEGLTGGLPLSNRTVLAFFAGGAHGNIRLALLKHWMIKDEDVRVYKNLPEGISYPDMMKKSKYCICPSGWEVASPRIVEAIYAECVPVLISQNYVLPFSDVLNWDSFSVQVSVSEIPNLKNILVGIPEDRYLRLQQGVRQVQRHFLVNDPPKRFDVFHMIIHSIWLRRLNVAVYV